jgi:hypothetical protein
MTLFFLPNRPEVTDLFNERERELALERINRDSTADTGATVNKGMRTGCCIGIRERGN